MVSRHQTHRPNRGDKVYVARRKEAGLQPNGEVLQVYWHERQVLCHFFEGKTSPAPRTEVIDMYEFKYSFSDYFGGIWMIEED